MSLELHSIQSEKRENRQNQTLLNRSKSCPCLSFRWPELLSRVLEKNLNIIEAVALQENRNAATTDTRIMYLQGRQERLQRATRLKINHAFAKLRFGSCDTLSIKPVGPIGERIGIKKRAEITLQLSSIGFAKVGRQNPNCPEFSYNE